MIVIKRLSALALLLMLGACGPGAPVSPPSPATQPPPAAPPPPPMPGDDVVCPADVKECPDGSYVSRDPARRCAFNPCPGESTP